MRLWTILSCTSAGTGAGADLPLLHSDVARQRRLVAAAAAAAAAEPALDLDLDLDYIGGEAGAAQKQQQQLPVLSHPSASLLAARPRGRAARSSLSDPPLLPGVLEATTLAAQPLLLQPHESVLEAEAEAAAEAAVASASQKLQQLLLERGHGEAMHAAAKTAAGIPPSLAPSQPLQQQAGALRLPVPNLGYTCMNVELNQLYGLRTNR